MQRATVSANSGNRVALVTGGSRGIGRGIALRLASDGIDIALNYRANSGAAKSAIDEIVRLGRRARAYCASVDSWDEDKRMVDEIISDFGRVDILVLNGGPSSAGELVTDTEINEVISVVSTHAFGAFYLCKLLVPQMRLLGRGDILMMSSVSTSSIGGRGAPYNMAKVALEALAKTLAAEERPHGVRVNVVAPGLISTDMGDRYANMVAGVNRATDLDGVSPFGRVGRVEDVANLVSFLVSDQASYLSNQRITVDGGAGLG